jgi:hypothetical protein
MNTCAVFMCVPNDTSIDKVVALIFRAGYGIAPFGKSHLLTDQNCPTALFALLVSSNDNIDAEEIRTTLVSMLVESNIPFYTFIVSVSVGGSRFAWSTQSTSAKTDIGSSTKKAKATHLKLVKFTQDEDSEEDVEEDIEEETPVAQETTEPEIKPETPPEPTQ